VSGRQPDDADGYAGALQAARELLSRLLAGTVVILIEGNIKQTVWRTAKLIQLNRSQMSAQGGSGVAEAGLP